MSSSGQAPPLTNEEIESMLKENHYARICTHNKDGTIHATPVAYEYYRQLLLLFEDILAKRKREGYRMLEQKLSAEKLALLEQTIPEGLTSMEIFSSLDKIFEYFDTFLKGRFLDMSIFPTECATQMMKYYHKKRREVLEKESSRKFY